MSKLPSSKRPRTSSTAARSAPFKGEVVEVYKKVGEWVQPGEPIVHLVRLDRVRVKGFVYAKSASPTEVIGKPVEITVFTAGGKQHTVKGQGRFRQPGHRRSGRHAAVPHLGRSR